MGQVAMNCPHCNRELKNDGTQLMPTTGTAHTLGTCTNEQCPGYQSTFCCESRPMTEAELAKFEQFLSGLRARRS